MNTRRWNSVLTAGLCAVLVGVTPAAPQLCPAPITVIPSGVTADPGDLYLTEADYRWSHSSTSLLGSPALEEWAWGFYTPTSASPTPYLGGFRTVVVVNNPDPVNSIAVDIEYYSTGGGMPLGASRGVLIGPEGTYTEQATPLVGGAGANGLGAIRVVSVTTPSVPERRPFVGSTVHHSYTFGSAVDPDYLSPGLASMQQLQQVQPQATELHLGPLPISTIAPPPHTFFLGNLPFFQVVNPNRSTNRLTVTLTSRTFGQISQYNVTLAPFGSYIDTTLFGLGLDIYTASPPIPFDDDIAVRVTGEAGKPLIGEGLMLDFFGPEMTPLGRFRMGSVMMANRLGQVLVNPELTYQPGGPVSHTLMGITNVSTTDIGPVVIEYRDHRNGISTRDTLSSFPPGAMQRIAPGEPGIVSYPTVPAPFDGSVRIVSACPGLVGWTMREIEPPGTYPRNCDVTTQFCKVYGEALDGANGVEPGLGFPVVDLETVFIRKVAPLDRCASRFDLPPWWPSYTNFANLSQASNIGRYLYRFFDPSGLEVTTMPRPTFPGVRWGETSFTFEDGPTNRLCSPGFATITSGRVDHATGSVQGIDVIGDPLREWELGFPGPPSEPPIYDGPGDIVPSGQ